MENRGVSVSTHLWTLPQLTRMRVTAGLAVPASKAAASGKSSQRGRFAVHAEPRASRGTRGQPAPASFSSAPLALGCRRRGLAHRRGLVQTCGGGRGLEAPLTVARTPALPSPCPANKTGIGDPGRATSAPIPGGVVMGVSHHRGVVNGRGLASPLT